MGLKSFNPYTASRRFITVLDKSHITKETPEKASPGTEEALRRPQQPGRNRRSGTAAAATRSSIARWISAATKTACRRKWRRSNTTRTAARTLRCCTTRTATSATSCIRWVWKLARRLPTGEGADILPGNAAEVPAHSAGHAWCTTSELYPGRGGQVVRSAGASAQLLSKEGDLALMKLPSGEVRKFAMDCMATVGQVGNLDHENETYGKAGRTRWHGVQVRRFAAWP